MVAASIRTQIVGRVGLVTLDAPDRRNAFTLDMCDEAVAGLDALEADDDVGALVITGEGSAFCAGADLSHLDSSQREGLTAIYQGFLRVAQSPLPTIAAVNGPAVGAGMNLALACDVRLAAHSARFDTRFLQLGIHPGGGHTWMMDRIVGPQATAAMVLFGEVADGLEAERIGLVWRCLPDGDLLAVALELAQRAAAAPRELLLRTKATIASTSTMADHHEAMLRELDDQAWSLTRPAFVERLAAMAQQIRTNPT